MTTVEQLARFVVSRSWGDLSEAARAELKIRVLDAVGCALGAVDAAPVKAIRAQVEEFGGNPHCTLIGGGATAPDRASLYNGRSSATSTSTTRTSRLARPVIRPTTSLRCSQQPSTPTPRDASY
jgi:hypothetical protein